MCVKCKLECASHARAVKKKGKRFALFRAVAIMFLAFFDDACFVLRVFRSIIFACLPKTFLCAFCCAVALTMDTLCVRMRLSCRGLFESRSSLSRASGLAKVFPLYSFFLTFMRTVRDRFAICVGCVSCVRYALCVACAVR